MTKENAKSLLEDTSSAKSIFNRLIAPSPTIFKNIITIMIAMGGLGISILGVPATIQALGVEFHFPPIVNQIAAYMIVASIFGGFISKLTIDKDKVIEIANTNE